MTNFPKSLKQSNREFSNQEDKHEQETPSVDIPRDVDNKLVSDVTLAATERS
jgi:hypothetical protein